MSCSLGVAGWLTHTEDSVHVIDNALLSMREAAKTPGNSFRLHDSKFRQTIKRQAIVRRELADAAERGELHLAFQPKVTLKSGQVFSAEALLRWVHPELGFVSPADFIPIAESTGHIQALGRWVINEATRVLLDEDIPPGFCMSVNMSVAQFKDPELVSTIEQAIKKLGGSCCKLELEVTESLVMEDTAGVYKITKELVRLGAKLALDDFGTGYSSLSTVTHLPIHTLKLDKSLIDHITNDQRQKTLVDITIRGAELLGVDLVAEGVETKEQNQLLLSLGCQTVQGYYFARPMPEAEFLSWIRDFGREASLECLEEKLANKRVLVVQGQNG